MPEETPDPLTSPVLTKERSRHDATIFHADYDPAWPALYEIEAAKILGALGPAALGVWHVGSTSVPGLAAKPLIDINLAVADSADEAAYVPALTAAGYRLHRREPDWYEHRLLKGVDPEVNMHVFTAGCVELERMLAFRDWLRTDEADRSLYEQTKRTLGARVWAHVQDYADANGEVVKQIIARALAARADGRI